MFKNFSFNLAILLLGIQVARLWFEDLEPKVSAIVIAVCIVLLMLDKFKDKDA